MAPGIFCVWSRTDPDTVAKINPDDGTFSDAITELSGVSLGTQIMLTEAQVMEPSVSHDIPFLTMYDLPDIDYRHDEEFEAAEKAAKTRAAAACKPRIYEELMRAEVPGCEHLRGRSNDIMAVVTCESPPPSQSEGFWQWQKETYTPLLLDGPAFIRFRVLKEVGEHRQESVRPSAPYLWILEWEDDQIPWGDLTALGQDKKWIEYCEGGMIWQGMIYKIRKYTENPDTSHDEDVDSSS